jgi:hypothetical protein
LTIINSIRLTFGLKFDLEELIGDCVLNLMVSEVFNKLGEDVGGFIGAKELRVLSLSVFEGASLKHLLVVVLGLFYFSQFQVDFVTNLVASAGSSMGRVL